MRSVCGGGILGRTACVVDFGGGGGGGGCTAKTSDSTFHHCYCCSVCVFGGWGGRLLIYIDLDIYICIDV